MGILIDELRIAGFRGIDELEVELSSSTLLIGINNSGKTSVIKAMQLALGDYSRFLSEEDFHIDSDGNSIDEIVVDFRIVPTTTNMERGPRFDEPWVREFGELIRADSNDQQFVAIRTIGKRDRINGNFIVERFRLDQWRDFDTWKLEPTHKSTQVRGRIDSLRHVLINAQRDIHQDLKEKSSFVSRLLSDIQYEESDEKALEELIGELNKKATQKSQSIGELKTQLSELNKTFEGSGQVDITPFPKKIRNLAKYFNIHFGESEDQSLPMEYHGMGTRSWASMLTVRAFTDLLIKKNHLDGKQLFPITTIEEPEAHLHPNAQRTTYEQLTDIDGQVVITSHSPYLVSIARLSEIRVLVKQYNRIHIRALLPGLDPEDENVLSRVIMRFRGEIVFSKALILVEGITEEQLVPAMYHLYEERPIYSRGLNCVSVDGQNYRPFLQFSMSFGIPVCIISDNDGNTKIKVESQIDKLRKDLGSNFDESKLSVEFLDASRDIESELLIRLRMKEEIIDALVAAATRGTANEKYLIAKRREIEGLSDEDLLEAMRSSKASYAGYLADTIVENPYSKEKAELIPSAISNSFLTINQWLES